VDQEFCMISNFRGACSITMAALAVTVVMELAVNSISVCISPDSNWCYIPGSGFWLTQKIPK